MYDILSFLSEYSIPYKSSGKNVSTGWVEVKCHAPLCNDPSEHLGINLSSGSFHCWKCGNKGNFYTLVSQLTKERRNKIEEIVAHFQIGLATKKQEHIKKTIQEENILPKVLTKLPNLHKEYLIERGFDPKEIQREYKIVAQYHTGDYSYRLIIPVFVEGKMVTFTSRDVTGEQKLKYKSCPNEKSIIPIKQCLYNIDSVQQGGNILIVEGVFDVWRMGGSCIATFGTEVTKAQIYLLIEKELTNIYIMYDSDAYKKSEQLAYKLSPFTKKVEVIKLSKEDPANLSHQEALEIRKSLNI